jgi:hypothetical protein
MGIAKLHGIEDHARFIASPGYAIVVYMHAGDCPSDQFIARCFEWAREYPFIRFAMIDTAEGCAGLEPVAFVPMATFFRNGKRAGSPLVGTDFARMESILRSMRVDGGALVAPASTASIVGVYIAPHVDRAIFARRKK